MKIRLLFVTAYGIASWFFVELSAWSDAPKRPKSRKTDEKIEKICFLRHSSNLFFLRLLQRNFLDISKKSVLNSTFFFRLCTFWMLTHKKVNFKKLLIRLRHGKGQDRKKRPWRTFLPRRIENIFTTFEEVINIVYFLYSTTYSHL